MTTMDQAALSSFLFCPSESNDPPLRPQQLSFAETDGAIERAALFPGCEDGWTDATDGSWMEERKRSEMNLDVTSVRVRREVSPFNRSFSPSAACGQLPLHLLAFYSSYIFARDAAAAVATAAAYTLDQTT